MTIWRESARVVIYRCTHCRSVYGTVKAGVEAPEPRDTGRPEPLAGWPPTLKCPKCLRLLEYFFTTNGGKTLVYQCAEHGRWHLSNDGLSPSPTSADEP
jgi:hypothetical protein